VYVREPYIIIKYDATRHHTMCIWVSEVKSNMYRAYICINIRIYIYIYIYIYIVILSRIAEIPVEYIDVDVSTHTFTQHNVTHIYSVSHLLHIYETSICFYRCLYGWICVGSEVWETTKGGKGTSEPTPKSIEYTTQTGMCEYSKLVRRINFPELVDANAYAPAKRWASVVEHTMSPVTSSRMAQY